MGPITAVGYVLRPIRAFFFDERPLDHISSSLIHGLYIHCTYYTLHFPLHLTPAHPGKPPTPRGTSTRDNEDEGPAHPSLSLAHGQRYSSPNLPPSIRGSTLCPPIGRIPGLRPSTFPFYLTSPPVAGITHLHPLPWRASIYPDMHPRQRQTDACSVPARNLPRSRLPVNPVRPAPTLPLSPLRIVGSHPPPPPTMLHR